MASTAMALEPFTIQWNNYEIVFTPSNELWIDFKVRYTWGVSPEEFNGFIKWDGCMQLYFPGKGPHLHFDKDSDIDETANLLKAIRTEVHERFDFEV